jgi:uncharacterized membrane protein HdeD (DUF308 family)
MTISRSDISEFRRAVTQSVHDHWVLYLVEGIIFVLLGAAAIVIPPVASLAVTIFLGWLFLIMGIVGLVATFSMRHDPGFWWSLVSSVLAIIAGVLLLGWPVRGLMSLTLVLIVYFIFEGVSRIMFSLEHRKELSGRWGWMLASGALPARRTDKPEARRRARVQ